MRDDYQKFYPYLESSTPGYPAGGNPFHMKLLLDERERGFRLVSTPGDNLAVVWDFGSKSDDQWVIDMVQQKVAFYLRFEVLEHFWTVCDRTTEAATAFREPKDRGFKAHWCSPEEFELMIRAATKEDHEVLNYFANTFSSLPVVKRFMF